MLESIRVTYPVKDIIAQYHDPETGEMHTRAIYNETHMLDAIRDAHNVQGPTAKIEYQLSLKDWLHGEETLIVKLVLTYDDIEYLAFQPHAAVLFTLEMLSDIVPEEN